MRPIVMLFAKAPVPGRVKTRLIPQLGAAAATDLHVAFVEDMIAKLAHFSLTAHIEMHTDRPTSAWQENEIARALQVPGDLGTRMFCALHKEISTGRPKAMVVGSDVPTLPIEHLQILLDSQADVALGPSEDGGFYAIACRRLHPAMFDGVEWGSSRVLEQTISACQDCGLRVEAGIPWFDIDDSPSLDRLIREGELPPRTAAWLQRWRR